MPNSSTGITTTNAVTLTNKTLTSPIINQFGTASGLGTAWKDWTPSWVGLDIAKATLNYAKYIQIGKVVNLILKITLTDAAISGAVTFTSPTTFSANYTDNLISPIQSTVNLRNPSTGSFTGVLLWATGGVIGIRYLSVSGTALIFSALSSSLPFTWANTHCIYAAGCYEAG